MDAPERSVRRSGSPAPPPGPSASEVVGRFAGWDLNAEQRTYLSLHAGRYAFSLALLGRLGAGRGARILDVGPSFQTHLFRSVLGAEVVAMGDAHAGVQRDLRCDVRCDLNACACDPAPAGTFDFVAVLEVIEHLRVAPVRPLTFLARFLAPGGFLVVQTPNAVALRKRLVMLRGRNPYEPLRESEAGSGHVREYTLAEVRGAGAAAGFTVAEQHVLDYWEAWPDSPLKSRLYRVVAPALPATTRGGITMVFRRGSPAA